MPDENKYEQDIDWFIQQCIKTRTPYILEDAENFAMSVANRMIDGGQDETTARQQQFEAMQCTK